MSKPLNQFLATGRQPTTAREKSALLDQCRDSLLSIIQQTKIMQSTTIPKTLTAEFLQWKKSNPSGTAQQFTAWKTSGGKPSPTIAAHAGALDPATLPRTATGRIDSLELTRRKIAQREADRKAASLAVGTKKAFKSNYPQP